MLFIPTYTVYVMAESNWEPDIYEYLDYREFLTAYYQAGKAHSHVMSFRYLSRRGGFGSPNYYKLVMDGERSPSTKSALKFAKALDLDEDETEFFLEMVAFNHAETDDERNASLEKLTSSQRFRNARRIDASMFDYLSRWYHPVIREMVGRSDFREDPAWVASQLLPRIDEESVRESFELLLGLGLLERDEDGSLVRGQPTLTTGHEMRSVAIGNYHRQMLERGREAIENTPSEERHLSAMTGCIKAENVDAFKDRINSFRESIIELFEREEDSDTVYQFNIQFFPLNSNCEET